MFWIVRLCIFTTNDYALQPNWFSGDKNSGYSGNTSTYLLVNYPDYGFPIRIDRSSTDGLHWLAWSINIGFTIIIGIALAKILASIAYKKNKSTPL